MDGTGSEWSAFEKDSRKVASTSGTKTMESFGAHTEHTLTLINSE